MKTFIKYVAIGFALLLAGTIISSCVTAGVTIVRAIADETDGTIVIDGEVVFDFEEEFGDDMFETTDGGFRFFGVQFGGTREVKSGVFDVTEPVTGMKIEGVDGSLTIERGETFQVIYENVPVDYLITMENGKLVLEDKSKSVFVIHIGLPDSSVRVTVPEGIALDELLVDNGSGVVNITGMETKKFRLDGGSGRMNVNNLTAQETRFDIGSGSLHVNNSVLGEARLDSGSGACILEEVAAVNLSVDSGSGRIVYQGELAGNCIFDSGSGSVKLTIYGAERDYNIRASLGSGGLYINGRKESDTRIQYEDAMNTLAFDSGSGSVSVNFKE